MVVQPAPIAKSQIEVMANDIGVTIPARPDMTLKGASHEGKQLFKSTADGFVPTRPHGELYLKDAYGVQKGTQSPPTDES